MLNLTLYCKARFSGLGHKAGNLQRRGKSIKLTLVTKYRATYSADFIIILNDNNRLDKKKRDDRKREENLECSICFHDAWINVYMSLL